MNITLDQIIESKTYFGTLKNRAHPKTRKYWLTEKNNLVFINPEIILAHLNQLREKIQKYKNADKKILIICEKSIYQDDIEKLSADNKYFFLNYKIPAGVLTNFDTMLTRIKSMNKLQEFIESIDYKKLTKKEKLVIIRQLRKLELVYKGVKGLTAKPDLVIIVDGKLMSKFVDEIERTNFDNIILANTDFDRWRPDDNLAIVNVHSYFSLNFILNFILNFKN